MTTDYAGHASTEKTPQTDKILGRESEQKRNRAGGISFVVDMWSQLARFLVLGQEGNTYYATEKEMVVENAQNLVDCVKEDGLRVVRTIVEYLSEGRCPKRAPALFALAYCAKKGDERTREAANNAVEKIIRIPTDLFTYMRNIKAFGGWGPGTRRGLAAWYQSKDLPTLALHLVKYPNRAGWSHRDALRVIHPKTDQPLRRAMFQYAIDGTIDPEAAKADEFNYIVGTDKAKNAGGKEELLDVVKQYNLVRECIPTEYQSDPDVQRALLPHMPLQATLRNLGRLGASGVLSPMSAEVATVCERLRNVDQIKNAKIHPIQVLSALKVYSQGRGERGSLTWSPVSQVCEALNDCFTASFRFVEPTGQRIYIGLDVSGSMGSGCIAGVPGLSPRVASAAMCLTHVQTEDNVMVRGFSYELVDILITRKDSVESVCRRVDRLPLGGTDCSLPMVDALKRKIPIDLFLVYTDDETWAGRNGHPCQTLKQYRDKMGIPAKLCVVGMTATDCSIADPKDKGMLDIAGFDSAAPQIISEFALGRM